MKLSRGSMSSDLCKHPHPDDGHCCHSKLPYPPSPLRNFDGRCPKNTILESADSALSSFDQQSLSKQGSRPRGICGNSPLSCYRSSPPCFDGKCPKNMIVESAESAVSSSDEKSLSKQDPVGAFGHPWWADYNPCFRIPGLCPKYLVLEHAESALSSFNEQSLSKQGPEYELIDALNGMGLPRQDIYHCNFIARLKNESEAEDMLFFAELKREPVLRCLLCCILGPSGIKTGEYGCWSCLRQPGLVQHPEDGFSNVESCAEVYDNAGRLMLLRESDYGPGLCNFGKVNKSQSRKEIKFPWRGSASTLSTQPPFPPPRTFDGRCPNDKILESAKSVLPSFNEHTESALSSLDEQSLSKQGSRPRRNCGNSPLSCYRSSPPCFDGKCPKNMIVESAESAVSSSDGKSLSKQDPVGAFGHPWWADYNPCFRIPGLCPKYLVLEHAESALSSFNEQSLSKQGPEYELIDALNGMGLPRQDIYHCNFIARLKNESEAEDMLFFAELKREPVLRCLLCCILGPSGIKTGEYGCWSCLRQPGLVQHPEDGFSNVESYAEVYDNAGRLMLLRESDYGPGLCNFGKVNKSQSGKEIKFPWRGSASTLSTQPPLPPPSTFDGRRPKDMILASAESVFKF